MSDRPPQSAAFPALGVQSGAVSRGAVLEEEIVSLFDQFRDPLLRYLMTFGLTPADGEEIVQEVFLSLCGHLQKDKSRSNLRGWLFRVAHNLALKRRFRNRRNAQPLSESAAAGAGMIDPAPSPEQQLAANQTHQRLQAILQALPEQDRVCLALRAEGLRYREIAEVLDMSLGAVSLSLTRSLARFTRAAER